MKQEEVVSRAEMVAGVITGTGIHWEETAWVQVVAKLPVHIVSMVDALAGRSGKTRTDMLSLLLSVGIEEITQHFSVAVAEDLISRDSQCMAKLLGEV